MHFFLKIYQHISILSLDVAAGAVAGALFFASIFEVQISFYALAALAITVWIVYTLDHLRDAMFIKGAASTDRHRYHQNHFRVISGVVLIMTILDFMVIWFLPARLLQAGWILGFIVGLYLLLQRYLKFMKEFLVACLYTAGILLPSMAAGPDLIPVHFILLGKYLITAWMNLLLFSLVDYHQDRQQQQHSFVTMFGPASTRRGILFLGTVNIISGFWLWGFDWRVAGIFISMNILLLVILFFQKHLVTYNYYRIGGDAVFFLPLLYLL